MDKIVNKSLSITKALPLDLSSKNKDLNRGFWLVASREMIDSTGDIIRTDGIDCSMYHNPQNGQYLKILIQHLYYLNDGTPAVVALVKDIVKTKTNYNGEMVNTLCLWCEWLTDSSGELLPLSKTYQQYMQSGGIDSGSVGLLVSEAKQTKTGLDVVKSVLYETSLVSIPALASANILRSLDLKKETTNMKKDDMAPEPLRNPNGDEVVAAEMYDIDSPENKPENEYTDECTCNCKDCKEYRQMKSDEASPESDIETSDKGDMEPVAPITPEDMERAISKAMLPLLKQWGEAFDRLSVLESSLITAAKKTQPTSNSKQQTVADDSETQRLLAALNRIDRFFSK